MILLWSAFCTDVIDPSWLVVVVVALLPSTERPRSISLALSSSMNCCQYSECSRLALKNRGKLSCTISFRISFDAATNRSLVISLFESPRTLHISLRVWRHRMKAHGSGDGDGDGDGGGDCAPLQVNLQWSLILNKTVEYIDGFRLDVFTLVFVDSSNTVNAFWGFVPTHLKSFTRFPKHQVLWNDSFAFISCRNIHLLS